MGEAAVDQLSLGCGRRAAPPIGPTHGPEGATVVAASTVQEAARKTSVRCMS
eukprot:m.340475 g.340475  ORF g.340475 m.340475 type:complete len:52 (+) comp20595_c0_seq6:335-490(+)